jgi:hypothetical protein
MLYSDAEMLHYLPFCILLVIGIYTWFTIGYSQIKSQFAIIGTLSYLALFYWQMIASFQGCSK